MSSVRSEVPSPRLAFGYWSDPLCIWALVAQPKLDRILAERGEHCTSITGSSRCSAASRGASPKGPGRRTASRVASAATRRIAAQAGRDDVSGACWRNAMPASSWAPSAAIKAVFALEREGQVREGMGARYQTRLRERFFVDERNVALRAEQLGIAEELGIPRAPIERRLDDGTALAAVWEDHAEKERMNIQGSPTYVFDGGRAMLYGNFEYGMLRSTVDQLLRGIEAGRSAC